MELKSLKAWMNELGYKWVEGHEHLLKGELSRSEAQNILGVLYHEGEVTRG